MLILAICPRQAIAHLHQRRFHTCKTGDSSFSCSRVYCWSHRLLDNKLFSSCPFKEASIQNRHPNECFQENKILGCTANVGLFERPLNMSPQNCASVASLNLSPCQKHVFKGAPGCYSATYTPREFEAGGARIHREEIARGAKSLRSQATGPPHWKQHPDVAASDCP